MKRFTEVSTTTLVLEALRKAPDEFMTAKMLAEKTGRGRGAISGGLIHLRNKQCVDVVVQGGQGWWFALPAESDTRMRTVDEHAPKVTGYKRRKKRVQP